MTDDGHGRDLTLRRRRGRMVNSQAKGPCSDVTLERARATEEANLSGKKTETHLTFGPRASFYV